jgi:hypothetical protein
MAREKSESKKGFKRYRIELTSLSILLWGACIFFLLAWIFVLGILVGRGFLPGAFTAISDLRGRFGKLEGIVGNSESHDLTSPKQSEPDPKLVFYEKLSSKKDEAKEKSRIKERVEKQILVPQKPSPTEEEGGGIVSPQGKPEASGTSLQYTVQLASLDEKGKAERMINRLIDRGYAAYYYEVNVKGKIFYRVRCGRFNTREEAMDHAKRLEAREGMKGFVSRIE